MGRLYYDAPAAADRDDACPARRRPGSAAIYSARPGHSAGSSRRAHTATADEWNQWHEDLAESEREERRRSARRGPDPFQKADPGHTQGTDSRDATSAQRF